MSTEFACASLTVGQVNALVKNIMRQTGENDPNEAVRLINSGEWVISKVAQAIQNILEFIGTTVIPAIPGKFIAREQFMVNTDRNAKAKISLIGDNFTEWFLSGDGKTEDPIGEQTLRYVKLKKSSADAPIIAELGGEEKSETALSSVYRLMEKQPNGKKGALLANGYANIFYVRDLNGVLRAVGVYWGGDGWTVGADSVEDPRTWHDGCRVFSRNSVLDPSGAVSAQV